MDEKEYIEREAVIEQIRVIYCGNCNSYNGVRCRACEFDDAMSLVEDAPAADVAPVVHGEWIVTKTEFGWNSAEYPTEYTCSVCGRTERKTEPYCHCGAKMDGGKA